MVVEWRKVGLFGLVLAALVAALLGVARTWLRPDPTRLLSRAQADFEAGRYGPAADLLERLEAVRAPTPMDRMARAQVAWARGRGGEALGELARIPDDWSLAPLAHLLAGRIEVKRGRARSAERQFQATLAREPDLVQAHRELAYLYNVQRRQGELDREMDALSRLGALSVAHLVHWGKTRNVAWDPSADCEVLERFVAADPDDWSSRLALVDGLTLMGQLDRAGAVLAPLPEGDPEARCRRVRLALKRGDRTRAETLLAEGPENDPDLARFLGELALLANRPEEAARHLRLARAAHPADRAILNALGTALRLSGDEAGAGPFLEAVRRHDALTPLIARASATEWKNDPEMALRLATACEAAGRFAESRAWYRLANARDPLDSRRGRGCTD